MYTLMLSLVAPSFLLQLDGSIPSELALATNLAVLDLSYNRLSGTVPSGSVPLSGVILT